MHYFIIAGEASGDLHASHLITALRQRDAAATITFLGGDMMAAAAGTAPLVHYRDMAFMGFSEVLRNLDKVGANMRTARAALEAAHPDVLILVDYPSFNLKMAAAAHKMGIPVYYYISPKIWAWKKWRIADIRRYVKEVLSILPFEPAYYRSHGYEACTYVGNPSVAEVDSALAAADSREAFCSRYGLDAARPIVALMPGSRFGEIRNNLPVMNLAATRFAGVQPVIIGAPAIDDEVYTACGAGAIPVLRTEGAVSVLAHSVAALVTSGTATLECALAGIPQVACYRSNGTRLTYNLMSHVLNIDYVTLPNLIAGRQIIPEMLLHQCTPDGVAEKLRPLLVDSPQRDAQLAGYAEMRQRLGTQNAAATAAERICSQECQAGA